MSISFLHRPRRLLLAAGVFLWALPMITWAQCVDVRITAIACTRLSPAVTYEMVLEVTSLQNCAVPWITLHSTHAFSPHIHHLSKPLTTGQRVTIETTLRGPLPGESHAFTLMAHCLRDGHFCAPCRHDVTVSLPTCEAPPPTTRLPASSGITLEPDRVILQLPPASPTGPSSYVVEASADMVHWEIIDVRSPQDATPSNRPVRAQEAAQHVWITRDTQRRWQFYRVREASD